jgi:hypothetical protein
MERVVIGTFDVLRPDIDPHFVQSNRIFERAPKVIQEMLATMLLYDLVAGQGRLGVAGSTSLAAASLEHVICASAI